MIKRPNPNSSRNNRSNDNSGSGDSSCSKNNGFCRSRCEQQLPLMEQTRGWERNGGNPNPNPKYGTRRRGTNGNEERTRVFREREMHLDGIPKCGNRGTGSRRLHRYLFFFFYVVFIDKMTACVGIR